jgi:hypothetical protein
MRYRDKGGQRRFESTGCIEREDANKKLRERLTARDQNVLEVIRKGEQLSFREWADFFLQNYSQPPLREAKTHEANMRAVKHLNDSFGSKPLATLRADDIDLYLRSRLKQRSGVRR